jgi:hypothetical protein
MPQPQPAPGPLLDGLDDRLSEAAVRRNKITGARTLWTAHNFEVDAAGLANAAGNRIGSRWYEIGDLDATPSLVQSGTLFDSAAATPFGYWMPSLATSGQGHMALAASRASASAANGGFASVSAATRFRTDAPGTLRAPALVQASSFGYNTFLAGTERWGDYSRTVVDPNDDQTIWTFQEYAAATDTWGVQVVQLLAPPPATPTTADPAVIAEGRPSVNVTITGLSFAGSEFFDPGPDTGGPGFSRIGATVSGGVVVNAVTFETPTRVTPNVSTVGVPIGPKGVTVKNPDGQSATGPSLLSVVPSDIIFADGFEP